MGERDEEGRHGKPSDFNEIKCLCHQLATFLVLMLNGEKSDELMKSYLQPIEKCPVRLFCVWCRK